MKWFNRVCRSSRPPLSVRRSNRFRPRTGSHEAYASPSLETLENRVLLSASTPLSQLQELNLAGLDAAAIELLEQEHGAFHVDEGVVAETTIEGSLIHDSARTDTFGGVTDLSETFELHSNPGASKTVYLDFDGLTTRSWWDDQYNNGNEIVTPAANWEGDSSFTNSELSRIQRIWARVAEDFLPFDVNITTEHPGLDALIRSDSSDNVYGMRVVIGGDGAWYDSTKGGTARMDSFGDYLTWWEEFIGEELATECFVFSDNLGSNSKIAEAISHEVGHTMGLDHDGKGSTEYYGGHGSGATDWAPIMGIAYNANITQWSKGEYTGATTTQDDLAIITSQNGFGYRADDHGNSRSTASDVTHYGSHIFAEGIIERNTDVDYFEFTTVGGAVTINVDPFYEGPNLDILANLYTSGGSLIATSNPTNDLFARFDLALNAGTYYISVDGTGKGTVNNGYSDYGSLGYFSITGIVPQYDEGLIDFDNHTVTNYSGSQTGSGSTTIQDNGASIRLYGNQWKAIDFDYTVTANTVLEFDFFSGAQGEQHAIGLDNDLSNNHHAFSLFGTQGTADFEDFKAYTTESGVKHYVIPVGQFYTGSMDYLYFIMDHDVSSPDGESIFSNVRVYEDTSRINFSGQSYHAFDDQNGTGTTTVKDGGVSLHLEGNQWMAMEFDYDITENTVLEFDFSSDSEGEQHGIGFDNNLDNSQTAFILHGTQVASEDQHFNNYSVDPKIEHYVIPVGLFFTGSKNYIYFIMDHDVSSPDGDSYFSNVKVYESDAGYSSLMGGGGGGGSMSMMMLDGGESGTTTTTTSSTQPVTLSTKSARTLQRSSQVDSGALASLSLTNNVDSLSSQRNQQLGALFNVASAALYGQDNNNLTRNDNRNNRGRRVAVLA